MLQAPESLSKYTTSALGLVYFPLNMTVLVAEPDKELVGELNKWVANPLGPGQTSALQIKTRSA